MATRAAGQHRGRPSATRPEPLAAAPRAVRRPASLAPLAFALRTLAPRAFALRGLALPSLALPALALLAASTAAAAQDRAAPPALPSVTVTGTSGDAVEKSYRRMVHGIEYFERARATLAPNAALRFKLLPRKPHTDMDHLVLEVVGRSFSYRVPVAPDHTFVLPRDPRAMEEDAVVSPNRERLSMTWRVDIRTPGMPAGSRRLGDLQLECEVGLEAGLVSNSNPIARLAGLFTDTRGYCDRPDSKYLYFAERPLFGVTLVAGPRREALATDRLYAMATDDPGLKDDLPYCDCEVLVDRTYFLPLGDHSWPDDTRVEFEFMDEGR